MKKRHRSLFKTLALFIAFFMILPCFFAFAKVEVYAGTKLKNPSVSVDNVTDTSVSLKWDKVKNAQKYRVYRYDSSAKKYVLMKTTKELTYFDSSLKKNQTYSYQMQAITSKKGYSNSNKVKISVSTAYYGLIPAKLTKSGNKVITQKEFCSVLRSIIARVNRSKLKKWDSIAKVASKSSRKLKGEDAMIAVYEAAYVLGLGNETTGDWRATDELLEKGDHFWEISFEYPDWSNLDEISPVSNEDKLPGAAYHFAQGQISLVSGKRVFPLDEKNLDMHLLDPLTRSEAVNILVRFYESIAADKIPEASRTQERAYVDDFVREKREQIMNSESEYTASGKIYYVSNSGNDSNDGLTPETAWKTLGKVNSGAWVSEDQLGTDEFPEFLWAFKHPDERIKLHSGDVVLFERGGLWRGQLSTVEGVTYSAYGEGEKPRFYGSPENGKGESKWSLVEGTTNIWKFHKPLQQCGIIVCDDGDAIAVREYAYYDGKKYLKLPYNLEVPRDEIDKLPELTPENIPENMQFFQEIPYLISTADYTLTGDLYLRCDEGNPGKIFSSMEFATGNNGWNNGMACVRNGVVLDNLCFRYGMSGVMFHDAVGATIRNCEVSYVGGMIIGDNGDDEVCGLSCSGDAILLGGTNNRAENNYITNTFDYGVTVEGFSSDGSNPYRSGCKIKGNLLENCNGGILLVDWNALNNGLDAPTITDITIDGNIVVGAASNTWAHAGSRYNEKGEYVSEDMGSIALRINPGCSGIVVKNNVFAFPYEKEPLICLDRYDGDMSWFTAKGNTFITEYGEILFSIWEHKTDGGCEGWRQCMDSKAKQNIRTLLKDKTAKVTLK